MNQLEEKKYLLNNFQKKVTCFKFSPTTENLFAMSSLDTQVAFYYFNEKDENFHFQKQSYQHTNPVNDLYISKDNIIYSVSSDGICKAFDLNTEKITNIIKVNFIQIFNF